MKRSLFRKKVSRLGGRYVILFYFFIVRTLPENLVYHISRGIAKIAYLIGTKYRRLALNNLTEAFKNKKSNREKREIAQNLFYQIAWGAAEISMLSYSKGDIKKNLKNNITIEGLDFLNRTLSKNKGVILVSAHFGNFPLITYRLELEGYLCNMIVRYADDRVVTKAWSDALKRIGVKSISARPQYKAVSESLRWLKNGKILCLFADQNKTAGIYVDFFGSPAGTVEGPALLSLRTGAPILCAFIIRLSRYKHRIIITPPIKVEPSGSELPGDKTKDIYNITQAYTKVIEDFARKYPDHWWWVHNRWKGAKRLQKKKLQSDKM